MKAVEMMNKAIKDSAKGSYKWTANKNGLHWGYLDIDFAFTVVENNDGKQFMFEDECSGVRAITFTVAPENSWLVDSYDWFKQDDEDGAVYRAARRVIEQAEYLF